MGCRACEQARARALEAARLAASGNLSGAGRSAAESVALVAQKFRDEAARVRERLTRR